MNDREQEVWAPVRGPGAELDEISIMPCCLNFSCGVVGGAVVCLVQDLNHPFFCVMEASCPCVLQLYSARVTTVTQGLRAQVPCIAAPRIFICKNTLASALLLQ